MFKRKILFILIISIVCFSFMEISLQFYYRLANGRFLYERMAIPIFEVDNTRYYKFKPNLNYKHRTNEYHVTYYTNNQGLRTDSSMKEIKEQKDEKTYRILFLGPSFAFGWANDYKDSYVEIIGENLNLKGTKIEVMNLGTPGQPINYQLCWFKEIGYKYNPNMIIQTVYGNAYIEETDCEEPSEPPIIKNGYLYSMVP